MAANLVIKDPRYNYVFCYTDTFIPSTSYVTIGGVRALTNTVYNSANGWNPGAGNSSQGVIGFNYSNTGFAYGDTFVLNTSAGNTTVSNYAPASYLFYSDGSSLDGWTQTNASVYEFLGNPIPSFYWPFSGGVMYRNFGQSFINKTIQFDVNFSGSSNKLTVYYGCNSSGAGANVVLNLNGTSSGFGYYEADWSTNGASISDLGMSLNNWATIKIVTNSGAIGASQLYVNNVLKAVTNDYLAMTSNTWWGFRGGAINIDNLYIYEGSV